MITTPLDFLEGLAAQVLPGCRYRFGPDEEQNIDAEKVLGTQDIFYVDDYVPIKMNVTGGGVLVMSYTVSILLLAISKPTDPAPTRWPRVVRMIQAGGALLLAMRAVEGVKAELLNGQPLYNQFDRNADGVALTFEIAPPDTYTYC